MDRTTRTNLKIVTECLADGLAYINDELDAEAYYDKEEDCFRVFLVMPTSSDFNIRAQFAFVSLAFKADGTLELNAQGLTRKGRLVTVQATAPSFTITAKKVRPRDYPGNT